MEFKDKLHIIDLLMFKYQNFSNFGRTLFNDQLSLIEAIIYKIILFPKDFIMKLTINKLTEACTVQ